MRRLLARLIAPLACVLPGAATVYRVDADAPPGGDGLSWATAFDDLNDVTHLLVSGDRIWLAEGTYTPTVEQIPGDPRSVTFLIPAGVRLYGGFDGSESALADRAGLFDTTVLDGELGLAGHADNAYHVLTVRHPSGIPPGGNRVDGLLVRRGNADAPGNNQGGGVMAFNVGLRLENVTLEDNQAVNGAGVHGQPGSLQLVNSRVVNNRASNNGGGLWGQSINLKIYGTRFLGNTAGEKGGGAYMHSSSSFPEFMLFASCTFFGNRARVGGGAFVGGGTFSYGIVTFAHCTFAGNDASETGGGLRANTAPSLPAIVMLHDSIVWANTAPDEPGVSGRAAVRFSDLQDGGWGWTQGNFDLDPLFLDLAAGDLRLSPGSPCIDAGDNDLIARDYPDLDGDGNTLEPVAYDADLGRRRIDDPWTADSGLGDAPVVDLGAFEYSP